ncbi:MAG: NYN domain-containing protein [Deltaproteobacteria bacterium]|nr:NYN domain-containing protein [Deltaproteobacteria bacterium]
MQTVARFAFFVDGSNLLGSLKKLSVQVDDYGAFFGFLFRESAQVWRSSFLDPADARARLTRVHWYEVGSMDEWDLGDPNAERNLRDAFGRDAELKRSFMALVGPQNTGLSQPQLFEKAWAACYAEVKAWYEQRSNTLSGIRRFHYGVQSETDFIDIIECGYWKLDLLNRRVLEKGLDTTLAVDMVTQVQNYDVAILVSGDADAIPSLNYVKHEGKHVCVIEFIKGYPPETKGRQSSSRLKVVADFVCQIYEMDLVRQKLARSAP